MQPILDVIPAQYFGYVTAFVALSATLATVLPKPPDAPETAAGRAYAVAFTVVQFVAFNFGKAANKG